MTIFLALLLLPLSALADEATCFQSGKTCAEVDIDSARAEAAFAKGCAAADAFSCSRSGQLFEVRRNDSERALGFYDRGCKGGDSFGCEQAKELRPRLCVVENKKKFCSGEPAGDYRAYLFLKTLNFKYAEGLYSHDFDRSFAFKEAEDFFQKRVKEKNRKLLKALKSARRLGRHDGNDAEMIDYNIECIEKKCPEYD
jgi:hypothetical protein